MNCKRGDLAWIVRSNSGNHGKIVECVALQLYPAYAEPTWGVRCSRPLTRPNWRPRDYAWCRARGFDEVLKDSALRPLRDSKGEDEMLRIVGRHVGTPQAA